MSVLRATDVAPNKILVIDQDGAFRATLAVTLQEQGFEVLQAATGAQGVQLARTQSPSLILCDVELQGVGGNLVLFAVRRDPQLASIRFVLMSRFAGCDTPPQGTKERADGFLAKPFTPKTLATTIDRCLSTQAEPQGETKTEPGGSPAELKNFSREGLLESLGPVLEATKLLSSAYQQLNPAEIVGLSTTAHQAALRLYKRIEDLVPAV